MSEETMLAAIKQQHHVLRIAQQDYTRAHEELKRATTACIGAHRRAEKAATILDYEHENLAALVQEGIVEGAP